MRVNYAIVFVNDMKRSLSFYRAVSALIRGSFLWIPVALSIATTACTTRTPASVEWRGQTFQEVPSVSELPAAVQSELGVSRPGLDGVADRNQPFNVTDVVDSNRPMRRFLTAGKSGDTWLVALEKGGRGYSVEVFLFSMRDGTLKQKWVLLDRPRTLSEIIQHLSQIETRM